MPHTSFDEELYQELCEARTQCQTPENENVSLALAQSIIRIAQINTNIDQLNNTLSSSRREQLHPVDPSVPEEMYASTHVKEEIEESGIALLEAFKSSGGEEEEEDESDSDCDSDLESDRSATGMESIDGSVDHSSTIDVVESEIMLKLGHALRCFMQRKFPKNWEKLLDMLLED